MDAKLKALKVNDLRAVLAHASLPAPARANKTDLVARILASQPALDAYAALYPAADDLLAPPEEVDWDAADQPEPAPNPAPVEPAAAPAEPAPASTPAPPTEPTAVDPELEKRKARAARFGIPVVEPKGPVAKPAPDDPKKLADRAARFGIKSDDASAPKNRKRTAPAPEAVDEEELARRKKRAERFGVPTKP